MAHDPGGSNWHFGLLDRLVDAQHRASRRVPHPVRGDDAVDLGVVRTRTPRRAWRLDPRWVDRLSHAGLLPLARMVEATEEDSTLVEDDGEVQAGPERSRRFPFDRSLLTALVDRWRPETHTFHLPFGEMAPTLQDVAMLLGLPIAGAPAFSPDAPVNWRDALLGRFQGVLAAEAEPPYYDFQERQRHGPPLRWLSQFRVERMVPQPTANQVSRHLEAYLLWLFGWVLFTNSHGDSVDARLVGYARAIADGEELQISWGSAVLAATYRGMCDACCRTKPSSILTGCPLLLQLWSFERFSLGRPMLVDSSPYDAAMYHGDAVDRPTVGSLWCRRRAQYAHVQVTRVYEYFVEQLDRLTADDVRWEPYSDQEIEDRAPSGLSSLCWRDRAYWRTQKKLVFDVFVEDYAVHRVMRQFGLRQIVPVPVGTRVPDSTHAHSRKGGTRTQWPTKMEPWVAQWENALEDCVQEDAPYDPSAYDEYLRWYAPQTRTRLVHVVDPPLARAPAPTDAYPVHLAGNLHLATDIIVGMARDSRLILDRVAIGAEVTRDELLQLARRVYSGASRAVTLTSCRTVQEVATSVHTPRPARPTAQSGGSVGARARALPAPWQSGWSRWARGYAPPPSSFVDTYPRAPGQYPFFPYPYGQYGGYDPFARMAHDECFPLQAGVDLSQHDDAHEDVDYPRENRGAAESAPVEVLSGSQLSGPPVGTQAQVESTPEALGARISRAPECLSLSKPRPRHPALRKPKRGRTGGRGPGVGRGDDRGGVAGGVVGGQ